VASDPFDNPPARRPRRSKADFVAAVAGGRRAALVALRDKLAAELAIERGFHAAGLSRELRGPA